MSKEEHGYQPTIETNESVPPKGGSCMQNGCTGKGCPMNAETLKNCSIPPEKCKYYTKQGVPNIIFEINGDYILRSVLLNSRDGIRTYATDAIMDKQTFKEAFEKWCMPEVRAFVD